ncbi:MAG: helix-turn-helix domain-containing protein [Tannerellaceae bacterium]|nr:helix-turn-helix domain-containing protein [Tannerellaceae bacterium]
MDKLPVIEIKELNKHIASIDNFQDIFSVADLDGSLTMSVEREEFIEMFSSPIRLNALIFVLVLEGENKIKMDYVEYDLKKNSFLTIMPARILQTGKISKDFKALMLIADYTFLEDLRPENRSSSMANYIKIRKNPCMQFTQEEADQFRKSFNQVREKIRLRHHFFHKELLLNAFMAFLLEMANIMMGKTDIFQGPTLSRKEEIMNSFLQLLLEECKEHHAVTYYAEKLCITPQYLSLVLKELTGKSANKWIDEALIVEAKILLKASQTTVQQVADILNFSDQSTFGKFFKKHMAMSPMKFRKSV